MSCARRNTARTLPKTNAAAPTTTLMVKRAARGVSARAERHRVSPYHWSGISLTISLEWDQPHHVTGVGSASPCHWSGISLTVSRGWDLTVSPAEATRRMSSASTAPCSSLLTIAASARLAASASAYEQSERMASQ